MSKIKTPDKDILDYIWNNFEYDDGRVDGRVKKDIGHVHYRGSSNLPYQRIDIETKGIKTKVYRAQVVWFLCRGSWPILEMDHIDRNSMNDKIENLQEASDFEQAANRKNSKMYKGFSIQLCTDKKRNKPWRARNQRFAINLGYYETKEASERAIDTWIEKWGKWWV